MYTTRKIGLLMCLFLSTWLVSCSSEEDPAPTNGLVTVTVNDPDGVGAAGAQVLFFSSEADASASQNVIQTFNGDAQGVVSVDMLFGDYYVRVISSDALLLDAVAEVTIAETNAPETVELGWDATAFVVGNWDLTSVVASTSYDGETIDDTAIDGEQYSFQANGDYTFLVNNEEVLSNVWEVDADESLIRITGMKLIVEAYVSDLNAQITVPAGEVADAETYLVTTNSRSEVNLQSAGGFDVDGATVTYSYNFTLQRR